MKNISQDVIEYHNEDCQCEICGYGNNITLDAINFDEESDETEEIEYSELPQACNGRKRKRPANNQDNVLELEKKKQKLITTIQKLKKRKQQQKKYNSSAKGKLRKKKYQMSLKGKKTRHKYNTSEKTKLANRQKYEEKKMSNGDVYDAFQLGCLQEATADCWDCEKKNQKGYFDPGNWFWCNDCWEWWIQYVDLESRKTEI
eukprot:200149_1